MDGEVEVGKGGGWLSTGRARMYNPADDKLYTDYLLTR